MPGGHSPGNPARCQYVISPFLALGAQINAPNFCVCGFCWHTADLRATGVTSHDVTPGFTLLDNDLHSLHPPPGGCPPGVVLQHLHAAPQGADADHPPLACQRVGKFEHAAAVAVPRSGWPRLVGIISLDGPPDMIVSEWSHKTTNKVAVTLSA